MRDLSIDFGYVNELVIGDHVFLDANANGLQDAGDAALGDVVVELRLMNGELFASTVTNSRSVLADWFACRAS